MRGRGDEGTRKLSGEAAARGRREGGEKAARRRREGDEKAARYYVRQRKFLILLDKKSNGELQNYVDAVALIGSLLADVSDSNA